MGIDYTNVMKDKTAYLSKDEIQRMLQHCLDNDNMRDYILIRTLYHTGRRITEIVGEKPYTRKVGLRPCDIHDEELIEFDILKKHHVKRKNLITGKKLSDEKLNELRIKKMPKRSLKAIDDFYMGLLLAYIEDEGIKYDKRVFPITARRAREIIKRIAIKCNITRSKGFIHPHNFRHSFAIHLLKDNPNDTGILRQVQELLDHQDINMTMTYAQFTQEDKKDTLNKTFKK